MIVIVRACSVDVTYLSVGHARASMFDKERTRFFRS